ncbi:MAG: hypothetical protein JWO68_813 [Actinomycetia bacterium]|nr:hypothetical protein [Actinomycetes bacterium]
MAIRPSVEVVLVPLDGSHFATHALPVAADLASSTGAEVHLLAVVEDEGEIDVRSADLADAAGSLKHAHQAVVVADDVAATVHLALDQLAPAVACMASHGRGRSAALVGSVATEVVRRGRDPLVLVGPEVDPDGYPDGRRRGIVACIDESLPSHVVLPVALRWSLLLEEPLVVLTVAEPAPEPVGGGPIRRAFGPDGDVEGYLEGVARPWREEGIAVETVAVFDPIGPAEGVRHHLRAHPARLVVAASRARVGAERAVFGSAAAAIVRRCPAPVLVVPRGETA